MVPSGAKKMLICGTKAVWNDRNTTPSGVYSVDDRSCAGEDREMLAARTSLPSMATGYIGSWGSWRCSCPWSSARSRRRSGISGLLAREPSFVPMTTPPSGRARMPYVTPGTRDVPFRYTRGGQCQNVRAVDLGVREAGDQDIDRTINGAELGLAVQGDIGVPKAFSLGRDSIDDLVVPFDGIDEQIARRRQCRITGHRGRAALIGPLDRLTFCWWASSR